MHLSETVIYILVIMKILVQNCPCILAESPKSTSYTKAAQMEKRSSGSKERFLLGPDGKKSVLADEFDPDKQYEHVDENGRCCCSLCNPAYYVGTFCTCSSVQSDLEPQQLTKCKSVDFGTEFMDKPNNSTVPKTCTENCKANQTKTSDCTSIADITCKCNEGWFNPNDLDDSNIPTECRKIPGCKAGEEPIRQVLDDVVTYTCQQCQLGFFKLEGNSSKSCEPHRVCQTQPASLTSDVKCLNDDLLQLFLSDRTLSPIAPLTRGTQLPPFNITLLHRLDGKYATSSKADEMRTSSTQNEERTQTPRSTPGENDHQTTNKPGEEPTGEPVVKFGYETAFYAVAIYGGIVTCGFFVGLIVILVKMYKQTAVPPITELCASMLYSALKRK